MEVNETGPKVARLELLLKLSPMSEEGVALSLDFSLLSTPPCILPQGRGGYSFKRPDGFLMEDSRCSFRSNVGPSNDTGQYGGRGVY